MRAGYLAAVAAASLVSISPAAWSKGPVTRIVIEGDGLSTPIEITDPEILHEFNIWNGPGVETRGPDGVPNPPAHLDPERSSGRFIDWPEGIAAERPSGLQRLEVTFHIGGRAAYESREYIVAYEVDPARSRGYIYLPNWTNDLIHHGVEGHWFNASELWDEIMLPIVAARTANPAARAELSCTLGRGSMEADGTIAFGLRDRRGGWRFEPGSESYAAIRKHLGSIQPADEFTVSCWPPRS